MNSRPQQGFTMTELIVVMTIIGILVAVGVPSFRYVTTSNRIATEINGLAGDLQFARGEAIKQGRSVTVCTSADGINCAPTASWAGGWMVFSDSNGNQTVDANEPVLRRQLPFVGTDTFASTNAAGAVTFNREGFESFPGGTVKWTLHDSTANVVWSRCLAVNPVGRMIPQTHASDATCL